MCIPLFRCLLVISLFFVSLALETNAQSADPQETGLKAELQPWQMRQIAFFEMINKGQAGDADAPGYDHQWVSAFGIESGKSTI
ncbi:MAG: hypothetical protein ABSA86_10735, partial [Oryzomonas sp.]